MIHEFGHWVWFSDVDNPAYANLTLMWYRYRYYNDVMSGDRDELRALYGVI